jgi:hypothetical protein
VGSSAPYPWKTYTPPCRWSWARLAPGMVIFFWSKTKWSKAGTFWPIWRWRIWITTTWKIQKELRHLERRPFVWKYMAFCIGKIHDCAFNLYAIWGGQAKFGNWKWDALHYVLCGIIATTIQKEDTRIQWATVRRLVSYLIEIRDIDWGAKVSIAGYAF